MSARVERSRTARALTEANDLFEKGRGNDAREALARRQRELSAAGPAAVAAATAMPKASRAFARPVDKDFDDQSAALAQAQSGFAPSASANGQPGQAPPASAPATKSAVRQNQSNATNLAF